MMDIVWVYKETGSEELKYSIKSAGNLKHGRNIVVGDKPAYDIDAEHIKPHIVRWQMLSPHHDVINKLHYATTQDISEDFICMNDDFFIMKPTDIPVSHRGTIDEHVAGRRLNDGYTKSLAATGAYLKSIGIENPLSYELHVPIVYNKQKLKDMYDTIIPIISHRGPLLTRSLYGNIYKIGGEHMGDVKNADDYQDMTFLSTNDKTFRSEIGDYIRANV